MTQQSEPAFIVDITRTPEVLHVDTMFGNEGEGLLHACISSRIYNL